MEDMGPFILGVKYRDSEKNNTMIHDDLGKQGARSHSIDLVIILVP